MKQHRLNERILTILRSDSRYDYRAYEFVEDAVAATVDSLQRSRLSQEERHLSPAEVVRGALDYAVSRYGFLAASVFEYWNLRNASDLGNIVFSLIRAGILSASPEDRQDAFDCMNDLPQILRTIHNGKSPPNGQRPQ